MEGAVDVGVEVDGDPDILVAGQDFSKVARTQAKAGFSDGSVAGHEQGVQEGFLDGLKIGFQDSLHWGRLRGTIQALLILCEPGSEISAELKHLLTELDSKSANHKQSPTADRLSRPSGGSSDCVREVADSKCGEELRDIASRVDKLRKQVMSLVCNVSN